MNLNQTRQLLRIARAIEYLYDHAAEHPDLAQVAAAVHVSPEHLQREFSAWAGISPKKMLQHISISRAKEALKNSESGALRRTERHGAAARLICRHRKNDSG